MSLLSDLEKLINEHGSVAILKERLALLCDQAQLLEKQIETLQVEAAKFQEENTNLRQQLQAKTRAEEFVEHRGALFKRKPEGGYVVAVYCPRCKVSAATVQFFAHLPLQVWNHWMQLDNILYQ